MIDRPVGCVRPGCGRVALVRGCCTAHYDELRRRVAAGVTTWERLTAEGLCLAPVPRVRIGRFGRTVRRPAPPA